MQGYHVFGILINDWNRKYILINIRFNNLTTCVAASLNDALQMIYPPHPQCWSLYHVVFHHGVKKGMCMKSNPRYSKFSRYNPCLCDAFMMVMESFVFHFLFYFSLPRFLIHVFVALTSVLGLGLLIYYF